MDFKNLKRQYTRLKTEIDSAIADVVVGGIFIGGEAVKDFERQLFEYVGVKNAISCANGSDALVLALMALGVSKGDAVFVPDFTYIASATAVNWVGATPVFVDIEASTFNISPKDLKEKVEGVITEGKLQPKAVITVDLFGIVADYDEISKVANSYDLRVVEDAAQAFGASKAGKQACSFGDIATTSFFPVKPLGCYGDGGAVFTNNDKYAEAIRSIKRHGASKTSKYDNVVLGMNSRLDTLQAAILSEKLKILDNERSMMADIASRYVQEIGNAVVCPTVPTDCESAWAQYTILLKDETERNAIQAKFEENHIPAMVYYPKPLHKQEVFGCESYCPISEDLSHRVLSLPHSPYMSEDDIMRVCRCINEFFGNPHEK
ncbi:MAG: DegT/DnrJ/EryC1/StrS family aminotransferase [Spirochaetaceae bacterium]|jgi:dTDP-4-amino-4,6-dideoxygalactose transaminase|nr:DegT/DnrJ/EryC1/StrS family aminotransferase [Spirochaetaceae bacterium]